jgi:phospholipase/carboxylesterase
MLHGRGADEEDLLGLSPYLDNRFLILSVRAPYPFSDGNGYTWYDMGEMWMPEANMFRESYEKLSGFVHDALEHYPVDKERIFLLGFSMGTVMCYSLALTHPGLFRGVVANSGYVAENTHLSLRWNEALHTEFFIAHGSYDQVIPVRFGRRARELCTAAGVRHTYREYAMAHQISEESLKEFSSWLTQLLE